MAPTSARRHPSRHRTAPAPARSRPVRRGARLALVAGVAGAWAVVTACSSGTPVPSDPTLARGQEVFNTNCAACHGSTGGGVTGPRLIGIGDRMSVEQETAKVTNGVEGTAMPAWGDRLSASDIDAVVAYTRSLTQPS